MLSDSRMIYMTQDMLLAAQWERVKGEIRAMVSMQGNRAAYGEINLERLHELQQAVEKFIDTVEDNGLNG